MKKRILSVLLVALLTLGLIACQNKSESEPEKNNNDESSSEDFVYNIAACLSDDNDYNQNLLNGFSDSNCKGRTSFSIPRTKRRISLKIKN